MATDIAAGKGPQHAHGHHGHHHGGGGDDATTAENRLEGLADTLGVSQNDLLDALQQGANLSDLLRSSATSPYAATASASTEGGVVVDQYA
jgi:hypothetical protein